MTYTTPLVTACGVSLCLGIGLGITLEEWAAERSKLPTTFESLVPRCIAEMPGFDSYLTFDGSEYACLIVDKQRNKLKKFLIALPKGEVK